MPGTANDLNISESGYVTFDGTSVFRGRTFQAGTGITITNPSGVSGNTTISSTASLTDLHMPRFIVASSTNGTGANFTTIASAIAAAQGTGVNSTIALQPGTYTENFTLPAGINLVAFSGDELTPNVTIVGNITCSDAGSRSISGIRLQTNGAALLTVSGSAATVVNLNNCYLNCTNNTGITFSSSSSSAQLNIISSNGNLGTTGIGLFSHSSAGVLTITRTSCGNSGNSTTASTCSAGVFNALYMNLSLPVTFSGTGTCTWEHCAISTDTTNTTCLTLGGGTTSFKWCSFTSGTASSITASSAANQFIYCFVNSSNANAITGAGTVSYTPFSLTATSTVNTTTQTPLQIGPKIYTNGGISFDAGTNILNIFQQGTFSPTVIGASTAGTVSMSGQVGRYQKVGRLVTVSIYCNWTTIGTATGAVQCNNLPFTVINNATSSLASGFVTMGAFTLALATNAVAFMQPNGNTTTANLGYYVGAASTAQANTTITASNGFICQLTYETT